MDFDAEKIGRIFSNLLSNALKFTPEGGHIYIRSEIRDQDFLLEIQDTGKGIPEMELPNIFNRFYQVDDSSTRKGEGTGIGLTLVKELILAMNGSISVESVEGKGTSFMIHLPITNAAPINQEENTWQALFVPQHTTKEEKDAQPIVDPIPSSEEKKTILLIEDNADVIHYLIQCLQSDYQLEIAMDGQEGIGKAVENTPDFIISDVMMPEKNGFEVCQTLKADERTSHIPIVLLTAKADIDSKLEGLQHGADAYLAKPFHRQELLLHIENLLTLRQRLQTKYSQFTIIDPDLTKDGESKLNREDVFLQKIRDLIERDLSNADIGLPQLVRSIGMSRSQIYRKVKALTGKSPTLYIRSIRLGHAKKMLETTDLNVSEVGYEVGFTSPVYFSQVFFEEFGIRPNATRK
ncbi:MAG: ATP-binding protein, partial [Bacteroidota bacterium]